MKDIMINDLKNQLKKKEHKNVDFDDIKGSIDAINKLNDKNLRQIMGKWNYKKVKNEYSESKIVNEYIKKYEQITEHN